ncbi:hypothetical protein AB0N07_42095 [Streptomyces sp. NPDC051172]|uniref:hypothetical protein n=1 Tax=Streptomyces sp. NPDC051172 TaxID=3155796 RepID=UPI0034359BD0
MQHTQGTRLNSAHYGERKPHRFGVDARVQLPDVTVQRDAVSRPDDNPFTRRTGTVLVGPGRLSRALEDEGAQMSGGECLFQMRASLRELSGTCWVIGG